MTQPEVRTQELPPPPAEPRERYVAYNQALNLREKEQAIVSADQNAKVARVVYVVYFVFAVLELLLGVRVLLSVLAANPDNSFADFIYTISRLFVTPFATLLQNPSADGFTLEITTIIAMIVYAILGWVVGQMAWLVMSRTR